MVGDDPAAIQACGFSRLENRGSGEDAERSLPTTCAAARSLDSCY